MCEGSAWRRQANATRVPQAAASRRAAPPTGVVVVGVAVVEDEAHDRAAVGDGAHVHRQLQKVALQAPPLADVHGAVDGAGARTGGRRSARRRRRRRRPRAVRARSAGEDLRPLSGRQRQLQRPAGRPRPRRVAVGNGTRAEVNAPALGGLCGVARWGRGGSELWEMRCATRGRGGASAAAAPSAGDGRRPHKWRPPARPPRTRPPRAPAPPWPRTIAAGRRRQRANRAAARAAAQEQTAEVLVARRAERGGVRDKHGCQRRKGAQRAGGAHGASPGCPPLDAIPLVVAGLGRTR